MCAAESAVGTVPGLNQCRMEVDVVRHDDGANDGNSIVDRGSRHPWYSDACSSACSIVICYRFITVITAGSDSKYCGFPAGRSADVA